MIDVFFELVRSGLYGTPISPDRLPPSIPWKEIRDLARKNAVLGLIIESLQFLPPDLLPPPDIAAGLNQHALALIRSNITMDREAAKLVKRFREHGIEGVVLKGQGVARYYRIPQIRQSGDIDFYVGKSLYQKAIRVAERYLADKTGHDDENEQHYVFYMEGVPIEIHRLASKIYTPSRNRRFQRWILSQLENPEARRSLMIDNTGIYVPSYDFDAIYIFYHAWRHYIVAGLGLRQLCDWTMVMNHRSQVGTRLIASTQKGESSNSVNPDVNPDADLVRHLKSFGMTEGWKIFGCIAVEYLGLDPAKMPLYDPHYSRKAAKALADILEGGSFGHYSRAFAGLPGRDQGWRYGVKKAWPVISSSLLLFRLIPVEAGFMLIDRMYRGTLDCIRRARRRKK